MCIAMGAAPVAYYLNHHRVEEWMIYRFLFISLLANIGVLMLCSTLVAEHIIALGLMRYGDFLDSVPWWCSVGGARSYVALSGGLVVMGIVLVWPGLESYVRTGTISFEQMHWSRPVLAAFFGLTFIQFVSTQLLTRLLSSINVRQSILLGHGEGE